MALNKKSFFSTLWRSTMLGCTIAVAVLLVFFTVMSIEAAVNNKTTPGMNLGSLLTIVLFSLAIAYARELFKLTSLPLPVRYTVNFVIIGIAYFFVILRSRQFAFTSSGAYLVGIIIYVFVYALVVGLSLLVRFLIGRRKGAAPTSTGTESDEYSSRFS